MKAFYILLSCCFFNGGVFAEDLENEEESSCSYPHYRYHSYNPEEDKLIEDRTETYWPGKRDNELLEELIR